MTNSHKNIINPFLESSTLLIMTFPEIVESKDLLWGRTCAVDNVRARRKGILGKLYEIQISPERGLRNSWKFPSYFGMEYVRPWNVGKKLLEESSIYAIPLSTHWHHIITVMLCIITFIFVDWFMEAHAHTRTTTLVLAPNKLSKNSPAQPSNLDIAILHIYPTANISQWNSRPVGMASKPERRQQYGRNSSKLFWNVDIGEK